MRKNRKLTEAERADAREALELLDAKGISLAECAKFYLGLGGNGKSISKPIAEAVDEFLLACLRKNLREKSVQFYRENLMNFDESFPSSRMDEVNKEMIQSWLRKMPFPTAHAKMRSIRALYNYGLTQLPAWCGSNPAQGVALDKPIKDKAIGFLTVKQCAKIMETAPESHKAALALMFFAGIRPEEIRGVGKPPLDWSNIDRKAKEIKIPASVAKTRTARMLQNKLPENLWEWLKDGPEKGPVSEVNRAIIQVRAKDIIKKMGASWPHDAMRHTFASYHVAAFGDIAATAELLGHGESLVMLKRHYQGPAKKSDGEAFFAIVP